MTQALTSAESRSLKLLGDGINPAQVSAATGLSESRISQLLSDPEFAEQVATLRYQNLVKHNERDLKYDELEDLFLQKLKDLAPFVMRPMEASRILQQLNSAKRRGASAPDSITQKQEFINLTIPVQVINQFKMNSQGQVVEVGEQVLTTVPSNTLNSLVQSQRERLNHVIQPDSATSSSATAGRSESPARIGQ